MSSSSLDSLPAELWELVVVHLDGASAFSLRSVSRQLREEVPVSLCVLAEALSRSQTSFEAPIRELVDMVTAPLAASRRCVEVSKSFPDEHVYCRNPYWLATDIGFKKKWDASRDRASALLCEALECGRRQLGWGAAEAREDECYALRLAAEFGMLSVLEYLHFSFSLVAQDGRSMDNHALRQAAIYGHTNVIRWLVSTYELSASDVRAHGNLALKMAADYGDLGLMKFLVSSVGLSASDVRSDNNKVLCFAAERGHCEMLEWLQSELIGLTAEDVRDDDYSALLGAASHGRLKVVQCFRSLYGLAETDFQQDDCSALGCAVENGHFALAELLLPFSAMTPEKFAESGWLQVLTCAYSGRLDSLRWLDDKFGISVEMVRSHNRRPLREAARNGHLEMIQWFHSRFGLTADDIRAEKNEAIRWAAEYGFLSLLQWAKETFALTAEDFTTDDCYAFRNAAELGHLPVLRWLHETFGVSVEQARMRDGYALGEASKNGHQAVVEWLHDVIGLGREDIEASDYSLVMACERGRIEVLETLKAKYGLTRDLVVGSADCDRDAVLYAAKRKDVAVLEWLHTNFELTAAPFRARKYKVLRHLAAQGSLAQLRWLYSTLDLTEADMCSNDNHLFFEAACCGQGPVMQWLLANFGLAASITLKDIRARPGRSVLRRCAEEGRMPALRLLASRFPWRKDEICDAFVGAGSTGHLSAMKWLYAKFGLTKADVTANNNPILREAKENRHGPVLAWLHTELQLG